MRKGFEKGRCPLFSKDENAVHIHIKTHTYILKCLEIRKWKGKFF
jgi:hypothetical protein